MEQRYLLLIDEQPQDKMLKRIADNLKNDGIELIYREINPEEYQKRTGGDISFDNDSFVKALNLVPFIRHLNVFATDYNLIEGQLKGIDVLKSFCEINPYFRKKIVIYSAQIEGVINDILTRGESTFEYQVSMMKLLTRYDVEYLQSSGEFGNKFKSLLEKEPDITIDDRIIESMLAINNDKIHCSIPSYEDKTIEEIGRMLQSRDSQAIAIRKEITDHIMAIITKVEGYE